MYCSDNVLLRAAHHEVYSDFVIYNKNSLGRVKNLRNYQLLVASVFNRSNMEVRAFAANGRASVIEVYDSNRSQIVQGFSHCENYEVYFGVQDMGYEKFTHAYILNDLSTYIICNKETSHSNKQLYDYLMNNFDFPLLQEWMPYLREQLMNKRLVEEVGEVITSIPDQEIELFGEKIKLSNLLVLDCKNISANSLEEIISNGLKGKYIVISDKPQTPLFITNLDSYFTNYGHTIVSNLEKHIKPLTEIKGTVDELALKNMSLYGQQASMVNGLVALLDKSSYAIINQGMGCGKTIQGASTIEAYYVKKYMKRTGETVEEVYSDLSKINYRVVIMCPGHLVGVNCYRT